MEESHERSLEKIHEDLLEGMREFMNESLEEGESEDDFYYTEGDIQKCKAVLDSFLAKVRSAPHGDADSVMAAVKETVLALNALNETCEHSLIETDQREEICDLIIKAALSVGVGNGDDITEEWRDW